MADVGGYGPIIIATIWAETGITLLFVCLRLYTRIRINRTTGWDDYLISLSSLTLIPYATAVTLAALKGLGRHSDELTVNQFIEGVKWVVIGQTFSLVGIATSKASVAAFLLRITIYQWHKWVLYILILCVSVTCFCCALFDFIRCDPIRSIWDPLIPGKCWMSAQGFTNLSIAVGAVSAAADFVLAILPWFILWNLQMKRKDKNLIASSMSLGLFAGVCGIIRTTTVERISKGTDYSYETVGLILWSSTELTVTILTATIPTLRPLYKQIFAISTKNRSESFRLGDQPSHKDQLHFTPSTHTAKASVEVGQSRSTDGRSDKSILGHQADGGIVCTDVVYVEYEERSDLQAQERDKWNRRHGQSWDVV